MFLRAPVVFVFPFAMVSGRRARVDDLSAATDCSEAWRQLCPTPLSTEDLIIAAMDLDASIAQKDALVGQELSDWCDFTNKNFRQCQKWLRWDATAGKAVFEFKLYDECKGKVDQGDAYAKTDIVKDFKNLCWAELPEYYGNPDWSAWAEKDIVKAVVSAAVQKQGIDMSQLASVLMSAVDVEQTDGALSANEVCLLTQGKGNVDGMSVTKMEGPIAESLKALPSYFPWLISRFGSVSVLKCRLTSSLGDGEGDVNGTSDTSE